MAYHKIGKCIDCGVEFMTRGSTQVRCPKCQAKHRKKLERERRIKRKYGFAPAPKKPTKGMIIDGHPQICTHTDSCVDGAKDIHSCMYALHHHQSRLSQGLYIKDGKRPAYRKGKRKNEIPTKYTLMPAEIVDHNFKEV